MRRVAVRAATCELFRHTTLRIFVVRPVAIAAVEPRLCSGQIRTVRDRCCTFAGSQRRQPPYQLTRQPREEDMQRMRAYRRTRAIIQHGVVALETGSSLRPAQPLVDRRVHQRGEQSELQ